jgi:hypothetical protein
MGKSPGVQNKRNPFCLQPDKSPGNEVCPEEAEEAEKEETGEPRDEQQKKFLSGPTAFRRKEERESFCAEHKQREVGKVEKLLREAKGRGKGDITVQPGKEGIVTPHSHREGEDKQESPEELPLLFSLPEVEESGQKGQKPNV